MTTTSDLLLSTAFLRAFLGLLHFHRASVCVEDISDQTVDWATQALGSHLVNYLQLDQILQDFNRPSKEEILFILCPAYNWTREYPAWAFQKNVVWMVAESDDSAEINDSVWSKGLRLDSHFYTYKLTENKSLIMTNELFRIKNGPLKKQSVGNWNQGMLNFGLTETAMWARRKDFGGLELVDTILEWQPFIIYDSSGNFSKLKGIFVDVLNDLQKSLNFTVKYHIPEDRQWGVLETNDTHRWMTGTSGDLVYGRADICTAGPYLTLDRQTYTDMIALIMDYSTIVIPKHLVASGGEINMMAYVQIFSIVTWSLLLISGIAISIFFLLYRSFEHNKRSHHHVFVVFEGFLQGLQVAYLTLLQRGVSVALDAVTIRMAFLTTSMLAYIMFSYYTSDLTAQMTYRPPPVQIKNFQVPEKKYQF